MARRCSVSFATFRLRGVRRDTAAWSRSVRRRSRGDDGGRGRRAHPGRAARTRRIRLRSALLLPGPRGHLCGSDGRGQACGEPPRSGDGEGAAHPHRVGRSTSQGQAQVRRFRPPDSRCLTSTTLVERRFPRLNKVPAAVRCEWEEPLDTEGWRRWSELWWSCAGCDVGNGRRSERRTTMAGWRSNEGSVMLALIGMAVAALTCSWRAGRRPDGARGVREGRAVGGRDQGARP